MPRWGDHDAGCPDRAFERFLGFCRFEAETGCVLWTGGTTSGRGHHAPYGSFWFAGRRWFAHRWAAKYVHGLDIRGFQVDHCCPLPHPNTLCVEHLQALTPGQNRELQETRKLFVHLQVGLIAYDDVFGVRDFDREDIFPGPPAWFAEGVREYGSRHPF